MKYRATLGRTIQRKFNASDAHTAGVFSILTKLFQGLIAQWIAHDVGDDVYRKRSLPCPLFQCFDIAAADIAFLNRGDAVTGIDLGRVTP